MNKNPNHLHKLKRFTHKTGAKIYFCVNDCSFRMSVPLSLGKIVECWRCGKPFSMNKYSITLDKPHCEECHLHKDKKGRTPKLTEKKEEKPLEAVASLAGADLVDSLKQRLNAATSESNPISIHTPVTSEIREFKLEEDEDIL